MRKPNFRPSKKLIHPKGKGGYPIYWVEVKHRLETEVIIIAVTSYYKMNDGYYCGYKGISDNADLSGTILIPFDLDKKAYGVKNIIDLHSKYYM